MSDRAERRRAEKALAKNRPAPARHMTPAPDASRAARLFSQVSKSQPKPRPSDLIKSCAFMDAEGVVHHGFKSHWELRASIGREDPAKALPTDVPGFWTVDDVFLTRAEAARLVGWTAGRELLSADIW